MKLAGCEVLFSPASGNEQASGTDGRNWSPVGREPTLSLPLSRSLTQLSGVARHTGRRQEMCTWLLTKPAGSQGGCVTHMLTFIGLKRSPDLESSWSPFTLPPAVLQSMFPHWPAVPSSPCCLERRRRMMLSSSHGSREAHNW